MQALKQCHNANPWMKFAGACNSQKHALNMCLREEVRLRHRRHASPFNARRRGSKVLIGWLADLVLVCAVFQRLDRTRKNQEAAKEKRKMVEQRWKEIEEES